MADASFTRDNDTNEESQGLLYDAEESALEQPSGLKATTPVPRLGPGSAYIIIISRVLGTGIFALPSHILRAAGTPQLALLLWILGALLSYLTLQVFLEFGCMLPRSGGEKIYLEFAYPRPRFLASTVVAAWIVLGGVSSNNCIVFAKYVLSASGHAEPVDDYAVKVIAALLLTGVVVAHGCFYGAAVKVQNVLGAAKIGFIAFLILTSIFVVIRDILSPSPSPIEGHAALKIDLPNDSNLSWSVLSTALFRIFYAYTGLENANNILSEVKNPVRTLKLVAPLALATALGMYLLVNLAYFAVIPVEEMKESGELTGALFFERVFGPGTGKLVLSLAVAVSALGNVMVVVFSMVRSFILQANSSRVYLFHLTDKCTQQSRLTQEVARQGLLPYGAVLGSSKPFGTPLGGLIIHYIPSLLAIAVPASSTVYALIADTKGYASQFFILALCIGLCMLRRTHPALERPYRAWIPAVLARLALCCALIVAPLFTSHDRNVISYSNLHAIIALIM